MTPPDFVANHVPPPMQKSVRITLTEYTEIIFCLETLVFLVITVAGNNYSSNWEEKMLMVVKGRTQMFYKHSKIQKRLWQVSTFFCSKGCVKKTFCLNFYFAHISVSVYRIFKILVHTPPNIHHIMWGRHKNVKDAMYRSWEMSKTYIQMQGFILHNL